MIIKKYALTLLTRETEEEGQGERGVDKEEE